MANGQLLRRAAADFDVFITIDRHIESQQNLAAHDIAVVLLRVRSNDFADVEAVIPKLFDRWGEIAKRQLLVID